MMRWCASWPRRGAPRDLLRRPGALGVAKGLFYHYFDSKQDALNAAVDWQADTFFASLPAHASDMEGGPLEKIRGIIGRIVDWKFDENRDMTITYLRVMYRPENLLLRTKLTQEYMYRLAPLFTEIIAEGVEEGVCDTPEPEVAAESVFAMWVGGGERLGRMILGLSEDPSLLDEVIARVRGWERGVERLLGIEEGDLGLYDYEYLERALAEVAATPDPDGRPSTRRSPDGFDKGERR